MGYYDDGEERLGDEANYGSSANNKKQKNLTGNASLTKDALRKARKAKAALLKQKQQSKQQPDKEMLQMIFVIWILRFSHINGDSVIETDTNRNIDSNKQNSYLESEYSYEKIDVNNTNDSLEPPFPISIYYYY